MFTSVIFLCPLLHPELFATEHAHVRMLSVLQMVFSKPLEREELLTSTDVATIFPSLDEIIDVHCECKSVNSSNPFCPSPCKINQTKQEVLTRVKLSPSSNGNFHSLFFSWQRRIFPAVRLARLLLGVIFLIFLVVPDNFYINLKKLRADDNFIVRSIRTTVLSIVSLFQPFSVHSTAFCFSMWPFKGPRVHSPDL